jgi:hypothetical protein
MKSFPFGRMAHSRFRAVKTIGICLLALCIPYLVNIPGAFALNIEWNYGQGFEPGSEARAALDQAASIWESLLTNDVTLKVDARIGTPLTPNATAEAGQSSVLYSYSDVRNAIATHQTSRFDVSAVRSLETVPNFNFIIDPYPAKGPDDPDHLGYRVFKGGSTAIETKLLIATAGAKALDLPLGPFYSSPAHRDAHITFSGNAPFQYNRDNGIAPGKLDFVGIAVHELGHPLGFYSYVDAIDQALCRIPCAPNLTNLQSSARFNTLDLFRYSPLSRELTLQLGVPVRDLSVTAVQFGTNTSPSRFFSLDHGATSLGQFGTGVLNGDGTQASHWKLGEPGIMADGIPPVTGRIFNVSAQDLLALDVVGWDLRHFQIGPNPNPANSIIAISGFAENRTPLSNTGTIEINSGGLVLNSDRIDNSGRITVTTLGTVSNLGTFSNRGQVTLIGFFANDQIGQYIQQASSTTKIDGWFLNQGQVANAGAITIGTTGTYSQIQSSAGIIPGTPGVTPVTLNSGTFTNEGRVDIGASAGAVQLEGGEFLNSTTGQYVNRATGTTQINGAIFTNEGTFDNRGRVNNSGTISIEATGRYRQSPESGFRLAAVTTNSGLFTNGGQVELADPSVFINNGQYTQQASGKSALEGTFANRGYFENAGAVTVGRSFINQANVVNSGTFTNQGTVSNLGTFENQGSLINTGTFQVAALGSVSGAGSYNQIGLGAQTIVDGSFSNNIALQRGLLAGTGTITGAVINTAGIVAPGSSVMPGTLTVGSYTQDAAGTLRIRLGGTGQYDVLRVLGPLSVSGSLHVSLLGSFAPQVGDKFDILRGERLTITIGQLAFQGGQSWSMNWLTGIVGDFSQIIVARAPVTAPEPQSLLLIGLGFAWLVGWQWKRRPIAREPVN